MSRTHRSGHYEDDRNSRDKRKWYKGNFGITNAPLKMIT